LTFRLVIREITVIKATTEFHRSLVEKKILCAPRGRCDSGVRKAIISSYHPADLMTAVGG
jgi:hypothetical protein